MLPQSRVSQNEPVDNLCFTMIFLGVYICKSVCFFFFFIFRLTCGSGSSATSTVTYAAAFAKNNNTLFFYLCSLVYLIHFLGEQISALKCEQAVNFSAQSYFAGAVNLWVIKFEFVIL